MLPSMTVRMTVAAALLVVGCGGGGGGNDGGVGGGSGGGAGGAGGGAAATLSSLSISPAQVLLGVTETQALTATGTYSDGSTRDLSSTVTWTSSAMAVVTVSPAGVLTAAMDGTAEITASHEGKTATRMVTVSGPALTSIAVTPAMVELGIGSRVQFVATGTFSDGMKRNVSAEAAWSSSATAVASVSATGQVTAMGMGTTTLEAALRGKKGSVMTTVGAKTVTGLTVTPSVLVVKVGDTKQLVATATYSDGSTGDVSSTVQWSVEGMSTAATVSSSGLFTAVSAEQGIRVRAALNGVEAISRCLVTTVEFALTRLVWTPEDIPRGLTFPTQWPDAEFGMIGQSNFSYVEWTSSNPAVLELQPGGGWKGVSVGTVTMTGVTYTATGTMMVTGMVNVTAPVPDSITIASGAAGAATLAQGATLQLTATGISTRFPELNADLSAQVTWSSSNMAAVTVDATGLARGVGQGTATITARLGTTSGTTMITVPATVPPQMTVTLSPTDDNSVLLSSISAGAEFMAYPTNALFMPPGLAVGCMWTWNPPIGPAPERFDALCGRALLKFDLSPLAGKTVVSARLQLVTSTYGVGSAPRRWSMHALASPWNASVTWATARGLQYYVYSETLHDPPTSVGQLIETDQTQTVKNWVSGAYVNAGWELGITNYLNPYLRYASLDAFELHSKEDPGGRGPKLIVTYR